ncbi:hypothetical protein XELAEV_18005967mg [Xenopus laevis]|uniref:P2X purinoreceptor 7 intracellular domain-containing protein n=1 Tax=Xenopus laevis TaxID=8355 RepID=A0A974DYN3_XENLA|nr:hypothetical protein XELAEV_18005967mg [Xenopus laevis]
MDEYFPSTSSRVTIDDNYLLRRKSLIQELQSNFPDSDEDTCFPDNPQRSIFSSNTAEQILPDPRLGNDSWCTCGHCIVMPTSEECVCCQEILNVVLEITENSNCITHNQLFHTMCLAKRIADKHYIMITKQPIPEDISIHHRNLRRTAYRSFTSLIHGLLGKGVRIAIPSCAVAAVRNAYADPEENYIGFVKVRDYCAMDMAFDL